VHCSPHYATTTEAEHGHRGDASSGAAGERALMLQERQLFHRERRAAEERRVAKRTFELSAANDALHREIVERKRAEAKAHEELVRVMRVVSMGELTASIAHEVNQPLAAIVANAHASLRWLAGPSNLAEVRSAVERVIADANRAGEVIARTRAFLTRGKSRHNRLQVDDIVREVIGMVQDQAQRYGVSLCDDAERDVPPVEADRVQLQQVILNLMMNAIEAMRAVTGRARNLIVGVKRYVPDAVLVSIRDSGIGLDPRQRERIFDAFYTTKPDGLGMGLAISRSIVEAHGGRLWPTPNEDFGATFHFTLPAAAASSA
jgi:C4-dicarboxylate-specific signal transduction histidine kinase